jgi:hypothetical protein
MTDVEWLSTLTNRQTFDLRLGLLLVLSAPISGCGSGSMPSSPVAAVVAPAIAMQPENQSVPMGLSATYSITATGSSLHYQWAKNGAVIANATSSSYVTPVTGFADSGASFAVTVSNAAGTILSNTAALTVTARAPMVGDLRFQQVDAITTVSGWGNAGVGLSTDLPARGAQYFSPSLGTPFYAGSGGNCGAAPATDGTGCTWLFSATPLAGSPASPDLTVGYASDLYDNFNADLQSPVWPAFNNGITPVSSTSVITSLDVEPANVLFAVSWIQSMQQSGFVMVQNTVASANLQSAATQEGSLGRVITAISSNGGGVTYLAYSWQADTATIYEAKVLTASPANASATAGNLAAQGYIITATGLADNTGDLFLVGTRVQGDTLARPFVAAQGAAAIQAMMQQGYAIVGVIVNLSDTDPYTYMGER